MRRPTSPGRIKWPLNVTCQLDLLYTTTPLSSKHLDPQPLEAYNFLQAMAMTRESKAFQCSFATWFRFCTHQLAKESFELTAWCYQPQWCRVESHTSGEKTHWIMRWSTCSGSCEKMAQELSAWSPLWNRQSIVQQRWRRTSQTKKRHLFSAQDFHSSRGPGIVVCPNSSAAWADQEE
jgi:hypothetical protein